MTEQRRRSYDSASASIPSDVIAQESGSSLTAQRETYRIPNRSIVQTQEAQPVSGSQLSSRTVEEDSDEEYRATASSETAPGRFQETQILSPSEVRKRTLQALHRAEQRRKQLREEEARYLSDIDS